MREVAEVHSGLYPGQEEAYGDDLRSKLDRCFQVTDREAEASARARADHRERVAESTAGLDLVIAPTLALVAPPIQDELAVRDRMIRFAYPINALGWPSLAMPCGAAEEGLPASLQLIGGAGDDALVLAAGAWLELRLAR